MCDGIAPRIVGSDTPHNGDEGNPPASSSSAHVAIDIMSPENDLALSLRTVPLVELSLEHVTYAPATRSAHEKSSNRGCGKYTKSCFKTTINKQRTTVLSDVTTSIAPYKLSAWMGPSGKKLNPNSYI